MSCSSSDRLDMKQIKALSKKLNVTINDLVMSATSCAFREYFRINGDKLGVLEKA